MADLDGEIRAAAAAYVSGATSLDAFEQWFVARTWDERTSLAAAIDHLLAERQVIEADRFRQELRLLSSTVRVLTQATEPQGASSATTVRTSRRILVGGSETITRRLAFAGTQPEAECG